MREFVDRITDRYALPLPEGITLLNPEKIILNFGNSKSIDFGALCYLRRSTNRRKRGKGRLVDLSSFSATRSSEIRKLIEKVSQNLSSGHIRSDTSYARYRELIRFMDWADSNQHNDALSNEAYARVAFRSYVADLRRRKDQHQLGGNSAATYQDQTLVALEDYLNVEILDRGVNLLGRSKLLTEPTLVPDDVDLAKALAWGKCLLDGFSELILKKKSFPFPLAVPIHLNWPDNRLWVFPVKKWCEPPSSELHDLYLYRFYDYRNGKVRTQDEYEVLWGKDSYYRCNHKRAQAQVAESNQDFFHRTRIERGMLATQAFLLLIIATTGMNPSQAVALPWSKELEKAVANPFTTRQGFRAIKYRANKRPVAFEVGVEFMPYLRRYLLLRKHLLNGRECDYLFFGYGASLTSLKTGPMLLSTNTLTTLFKTLRRLSPTVHGITPRQLRAAKQDHLIRTTDPATAATVMQHSQAVMLKHYSNGSEVTQQIDMSNFFSRIEKVVLKKGEEIAGSEGRSVGTCISPEHPKAVAADLPITPDCKGSEGCLFCDKYRAHADETDVRKLLSARFCIRKTSALANSAEQFDQLFGRILQRIDFILGEIMRHDLEMVDKIEGEVDEEGELTPFWSAKLELLVELEIL